MNLKENTERVFQQIKDASQQAGREANSVSVVAVTKYVDVPTAEALLPLGVHHIGENRVDKFLEKYEALKDRNITWHLIGTLQRRKVKDVIQYVDYFHALDSLKLAEEIQKRSDRVVKCFLQVNISREESKHGFSKEELLELLPELATLDKIEYVGLMTMAPFEASSDELKEIFKVEEIRVYFGIILGAGTFIALNIRSLYGSLGEAFRHAFFQVGSIITTCGYATTDFDLWPETSKMILVLLMFIGACAGSTGGGFKISRLLILCKAIPKQLSLVIHPREVKVIRMDGKPIDHNTLRSTNVYLAIYFFILLVSTLLISVDNFNLTTNFTAVASTLNNIGPGLDGVGPTRNFGMYSDFSKFVLMFDMLAGRLELYPLLILFMPSLWRRK